VHAQVSTLALAGSESSDGLLLDLDRTPYAATTPTPVPANNAYSLRLVVNRVLYDEGAGLQHTEHARNLIREGALHLGTSDSSQLGISTGTQVTVTSSNGSLTTSAVVDPTVPRGSALLRHNVRGADAGVLVSAGDVVCDVRVEVG
jgi:predicted molibdopterin-dependent oxidoreductase YjgC